MVRLSPLTRTEFISGRTRCPVAMRGVGVDGSKSTKHAHRSELPWLESCGPGNCPPLRLPMYFYEPCTLVFL